MTIDELRAFCMSLPGTHEKETWGDAEHAGDVTFRVKDKIYVMTGQSGGGASIRTTIEQQADLIAAFPESVSIARVRRPVRLGRRQHRGSGRARSRGRPRRHSLGLAPDDPEVDARASSRQRGS